MSYKLESCYLSAYGKVLMYALQSKGLDEDLALEILHLTVPAEELYSLDEEDEKSGHRS